MFAPIKFEISAPGKVILFGEHSVVYGKPALAASINKRTSLVLETVPSGDIEIEFPDLDLKIRLLVDEIDNSASVRGSSGEEVDAEALLKRAMNDVTHLENAKNFSHNQNTSLQCVFYLLRGLFSSQKISVGFKIMISSELTIGAGTGSSASFSVCLTAALYQLRRILQAGERKNLDTDHLRKFSSEDKETINEWAFACEQIIHGKASGIDNFVCTYGCVVEMLPNSAGQKRKLEVLSEAPKLRVLLINTGISRNTSALVKKVAELRNNNQTVVDLMLDAMEEIVKSARTLLLRLNEPKNQDSFSRLEDLVFLNQGLLSSLGVSHESLDNIVSITKKHGLRSKLTGAGGGGFAIALVPPTASQDGVQSCVTALQRSGYQVDDIIVGDEGVNIKMN